MKPVSELSDQELNEWVAVKIMDLQFVEANNGNYLAWCDNKRNCIFNYFSPCQDLNHVHLMEEKIREKGSEYLIKYSQELYNVVNLYFPIFATPVDFEHFALTIHATARQKCEAAYLTFNSEKQLNSEG